MVQYEQAGLITDGLMKNSDSAVDPNIIIILSYSVNSDADGWCTCRKPSAGGQKQPMFQERWLTCH